MRRGAGVIVLIAALVGCAFRGTFASAEAESRVEWLGDEAKARERALELGRPLLQRVGSADAEPGTELDPVIRLFDHPLWREVAEREFVPVASTASDQRKRGWFIVPIGRDGNTLGERKPLPTDSVGSFARAIVAELRSMGRPIPGYLASLERETFPARTDIAVFGMG